MTTGKDIQISVATEDLDHQRGTLCWSEGTVQAQRDIISRIYINKYEREPRSVMLPFRLVSVKNCRSLSKDMMTSILSKIETTFGWRCFQYAVAGGECKMLFNLFNTHTGAIIHLNSTWIKLLRIFIQHMMQGELKNNDLEMADLQALYIEDQLCFENSLKEIKASDLSVSAKKTIATVLSYAKSKCIGKLLYNRRP